MGNDILTTYASGHTLYCVIYNSNGLYWNGSDWEIKQPSHWPNYVTEMVETQIGLYKGTFPNTIGAGLYFMMGFIQSSSTPSPTDILNSIGTIDWTGSEEYSGGVISGSGSSVEIQYATGVDNNRIYDITTGINDIQDDIIITSGVI